MPASGEERRWRHALRALRTSEWRTLAARAGRRRRARERWSRRRRVLTALGVLLALLVLPVLGAGTALRWEYAGDPAADARTRGKDAIWLGHAWVDGRRSQEELASLADKVRGTGIHDLYVHTGPLEHDGSLDPALAPKAADFVARAHAAMPGVRVQSWLGDVVAPEKDGLHLDRADVRDRMTASAKQVLDLGFDGVHLDLEPVHSGSPGFLRLLEQVRVLTKERAVPLSIAAPQIDPVPGLGRVTFALSGHGKYWSAGYFAAAARRVDQVAVMSYDTSMPVESLYGGYVARQTDLALANTPPDVDLLMGLPAYWADTPTHRGDAETVRAAVRGARLALGPGARQNFGLALYVDFAATPDHWAAYRDGWCV
ncbi:hypothetical protein [Streptomyces sp. TLI_171]|uniref:hypothetical protein n=1 Tax=Streptomyces sp. TLI_171 TaxID=1938859 RepID=UPI000C54DF5B|nr:hypothetical protein [Streptomyces sp. TLI_171]RKE22754.1 hypothetical protein BX266_6207 [Streptomyces sp. TLI_171]